MDVMQKTLTWEILIHKLGMNWMFLGIHLLELISLHNFQTGTFSFNDYQKIMKWNERMT